ncbi:MAG: hypothetical protein V2B15_11425 [Bacteroidota bacterium]
MNKYIEETSLLHYIYFMDFGTLLKEEDLLGRSILISIKPKFANHIFDGTKKYEYRKIAFSKDPEFCIVYASYPIKKIIGFFKVGNILKGSSTDIWERTNQYGGIDLSAYLEYSKESAIIIAIQILNPTLLIKPIDPFLVNPNFKPPQSFIYI